MERLKSVLADKIIDISSDGGYDVKGRMDKIQRFREFAIACQSLMVRYPAIEDELIEMVNVDDFDTKRASSRVDAVIRLSETPTPSTLGDDVEQLEIINGQFEEEKTDNNYPDKIIFPDKTEIETARGDNSPINKENIKRIIQVCVITLVVVALIFLIVFVIKNIVAILYTIGGIAVIALLIWIILKFRKNKE
ncbi:hypothetical protein [Dysgonomonas sp. 520]|uniref:hypothetical protein n=1 Tax=Dysgonomonas sp. 520 TaxID=2302931 RepID=UPI0013D2F5CA|nr:hypothetical protein [Dysgonomonas sp. 520]NDW09221.1 hypothetical protein [Dysgonomonas sp. 520]